MVALEGLWLYQQRAWYIQDKQQGPLKGYLTWPPCPAQCVYGEEEGETDACGALVSLCISEELFP